MLLKREIQQALERTAAGRNLDPALLRDLASSARSVLLRHGLEAARIHVRQVGMGVEVEVIPPPHAPHVERIHLRMG